jgi:hypothetical protein
MANQGFKQHTVEQIDNFRNSFSGISRAAYYYNETGKLIHFKGIATNMFLAMSSATILYPDITLYPSLQRPGQRQVV